MPLKSKRPIGVDLFAGAGGMSLGFEQAGFDVVASVEVDPVHAAVHKFNFPKCAVIAKPVEQVGADEIRKLAGIEDATVDCVFGGAPCQGFSLIGQRILDDPRNFLVKEFLRLVVELDARSFVFENVKGLTLGEQKKFLFELVQSFEAAGYKVLTPWQVLNAAHFAVPQSRERLFLMGVKQGEALPAYPTPQTNAAGAPKRFKDLPYGPTCEDALGDLPDIDSFDTLLGSDWVKTTRFGPMSDYATELRGLTNTSAHFGYPRIAPVGVLSSSARTKHSDISKRRFRETKPGKVEPISRFYKLSPEGISNTLRAGTDGARGAFTSPRPIHYKFARCVSVREMARLHGFPDWFRFNATKWHGARQIGNSVPPPLARAVAGQLVSALGFQLKVPDRSIELENTSLLSFDLSAAAKFFDVAPPASRRTTKSGSKKRKQIDIENERLKGASRDGQTSEPAVSDN